MNEIGNDNRVCILATDYRDEKEKNQICETLESNFTDLNLFFFKFSKIIENSMSSGAYWTLQWKQSFKIKLYKFFQWISKTFRFY